MTILGSTNWTLEDIRLLIGEPESVKLEFKESKLFFQDPQNQETSRLKKYDEIGQTLSKYISAFANTVGGTIIIGIKERREGTKKVGIADGIDDGVKAADISIEQLQRTIQGNLQPYLPGIRVLKRMLPSAPDERCIFVIDVPAGITAYQAADHKYYGRSEYEVRSLADHEIRMRMMRAQSAVASLEISSILFTDGDRTLHPKHYKSSNFPNEQIVYGNEYNFTCDVRNRGLITLRCFDLILERQGHRQEQITCQSQVSYPDVILDRTHFEPLSELKLFPDQSETLTAIKLWIAADSPIKIGDCIVKWTIYLDNSPPSSGEFDLACLIEAALTC